MSVQIPYDRLQPATLRAVIEEFVTRHGAVHGHSDVTLDKQIEQVHKLLQKGDAVLMYDEDEGGCTIVLKRDLQ